MHAFLLVLRIIALSVRGKRNYDVDVEHLPVLPLNLDLGTVP